MRMLVAALGILSGTLACSAELPSPAAEDPPVITPDDAERPQAGEDYTLLGTLGPDAAPVDATGAGKVVLWDTVRGRSGYSLLDPRTGRRTPLPTPAASLFHIDRDTIWYAETTRVSARTTVYRYDRHTRRMRSFLLPPDPARPASFAERIIGLDGDVIWYGIGRRASDIYEDVWSVRFGKARTRTKEARHQVLPVVAGGVLAWTERHFDGSPSQVALRDLATGRVTRADLPEGCSPRDQRVQGNGEEFVVAMTCAHPESVALVVDRSGVSDAVIEAAGDDGPVGTGDRGVFFYRYFFDFTTGRLLDITNKRYGADVLVSSGGEHPVQVWPQRHRQLVVRLK